MTATLLARPAAAPRPLTGPELLHRSAVLLPSVVDKGQTTASNVHVAVYKAALQLRDGCDAGTAHQLAGEAIDLLVAYLADLHDLRGASREVQYEAMRGWAFRRNVGAVCFALRAAAEHWRAELLLAAFAPATAGR
ncbi:hypothetical protein [Paractinoplanes atraurantiacus]|uniref:Uncharacterized protein n=1 Tax=Paractinoplanes atraurantiacus TaxID=1036182 RepID=A0A285KLM6_9ACTN|nr:hypothetical protein [Actinoplanes atraurantiacus]SNY72777.1 hypothetical protein SAMN05421748_14411 [Actinoplanes atraurantiacus]